MDPSFIIICNKIALYLSYSLLPHSSFQIGKVSNLQKNYKNRNKIPIYNFYQTSPPSLFLSLFLSLSLSIFQTHTLSELFESKLLEHDPPTFCISPNNKDILNCHNAMIAFSKLSIITMLPSQQGSFRKRFP